MQQSLSGTLNGATKEVLSCTHCGQGTTKPIYAGQKIFCCRGCEFVYEYIGSSRSWELYDEPQQGLQYKNHLGQYVVYLRGLECQICEFTGFDWNLSQAQSCQWDFEKRVVTLRTEKFSKVLEELDKRNLGPVPLKVEEQFLKKSLHGDLARLGVAAFCSGNIMIMAIANYAGAEDSFSRYFDSVSLLLTLPTLFYSAGPMIRLSFRQLLQKRISVDLPITIALLSAFGVSLWNFINLSGGVYFDTVTMLVFLLLFSRLFLNQLFLKSQSGGQFWLQQAPVYLESGQKSYAHKLQAHQTYILKGQDMVPTDSSLLTKEAWFDESAVTGESVPTLKKMNEKILLGSRLLSSGAKCTANTSLKDSQLYVDLQDKSKSGHVISSLERVSKYYLIIILGIVTIYSVLGYYLSFESWPYRSLAFLIVTCPCTFAFSEPLVLSLALRKSFELGVYIRNQSVFLKLKDVLNIFLDKTGTLTEGKFSVTLPTLAEDEQNILAGLVSKSSHVVAQSIFSELLKQGANPVVFNEIKDLYGRGLSGVYNEQRVDLLRTNDQLHTLIFRIHHINGTKTKNILLVDKVKNETQGFIKMIKALKLKPVLLSGDHDGVVRSVASELEVDDFYSDCRSEDKARILNEHSPCIFVGDGLNDIQALNAATIGISIRHDFLNFEYKADAHFVGQNIKKLGQWFLLARRVPQIIRRNLWIAVIYNFAAGGLALVGVIHPLLAAVIMPLGALTVFLFSWSSFYFFRGENL